MTTGKQQQNEDLTTDYLKFNNILRRLEPVRRILGQAAIAHLLPQKSKLLMLNEPTIRSMLRLCVNSQAALNHIPQPHPNQITLF